MARSVDDLAVVLVSAVAGAGTNVARAASSGAYSRDVSHDPSQAAYL